MEKPLSTEIGRNDGDKLGPDGSFDTPEGKYYTKHASTTKEKIDFSVPNDNPVIIRTFRVKLPPLEVLKAQNISDPTEAELLLHHQGSVMQMLDQDGWDIVGGIKCFKNGRMFVMKVRAKANPRRSGGFTERNLFENAKSIKQLMTKNGNPIPDK
jgi:hypothetical protein